MNADNVLLIAAIFLHVLLLAVLFQRGWAKRCPMLAMVILASLAGQPVITFMHHHYGGTWAEFYTYWAIDLCNFGLYLLATIYMRDWRLQPVRWSMVIYCFPKLICFLLLGFRHYIAAVELRSNLRWWNFAALLFWIWQLSRYDGSVAQRLTEVSNDKRGTFD